MTQTDPSSLSLSLSLSLSPCSTLHVSLYCFYTTAVLLLYWYICVLILLRYWYVRVLVLSKRGSSNGQRKNAICYCFTAALLLLYCCFTATYVSSYWAREAQAGCPGISSAETHGIWTARFFFGGGAGGQVCEFLDVREAALLFFLFIFSCFFLQSAGRNESRDATFGGQSQAGLQVVCHEAT
jgi:hypothetical protein